MRTAKRMGLRTVAVYSDADRDAMHVALADEAVLIGPAPAKDSYLHIDAIIDAARTTGAEAIHPGYGFVSENADFAQACADAGLVFVGPSAATIRLMGSKSAAKALMESAGVPVVPGYHGEDQSIATLQAAADRIGYPVLVKASAGGGGRGMRLVANAEALAEAVASAKREAAAAFGNDQILIEQYMPRPRHIEVQVFGDSEGNVVSLFERECTLQRRHQKVVEEALSASVTAERRAAMSAAARSAAQGFLPAAGTIRAWREPAGNGIRIDTGFRAGDAVTPYYDALLAKLIAWGADRPQALARLVEALDAFGIEGVTTNLAFLRALLRHPQVVRNEIDIGFIERELAALTRSAPSLAALDLAAACAAVLLREQREQISQDGSPWDRTDGWTLAGRRSRRLSFRDGGERYDAVLWYGRDGLSMEFGGTNDRLQFVPREGGVFDMCLGDAPERVSVAWSGRDLDLTTLRGRRKLHWIDPFVANISKAAATGRIVAPMPGTVTRIRAEPGAGLQRGAPLIVLEAMKMEHTLRAPADGRLKALKCAVGDFVQEGTELADFELVA